MFSSLTNSSHNRSRCSKHQCTRTKHYQHSNTDDDISSYYIAYASNHQCNRNQSTSNNISYTLNRSLFLFRIFNKLNHFLNRTIFAHFGSYNIYGTKTVNRSAKYIIINCFINRYRLSCHNGLIYRCFTINNASIYRDCFARKDS